MSEVQITEQMKDTLTKLLETGLGRGGKLTYDEVGEKLAALKAGAEQMEEALKYLAEHHVEVVKSIAPVQLSEKINREVKRLIEAGKRRGHLTYDEVGEKLAVECEANAEQVEEVFRILAINNIDVIMTQIDI